MTRPRFKPVPEDPAPAMLEEIVERWSRLDEVDQRTVCTFIRIADKGATGCRPTHDLKRKDIIHRQDP